MVSGGGKSNTIKCSEDSQVNHLGQHEYDRPPLNVRLACKGRKLILLQCEKRVPKAWENSKHLPSPHSPGGFTSSAKTLYIKKIQPATQSG